MLDLARQGKAAKEVAKVVGQGEELEPDLVVTELMAGKPCPSQRDLLFLDPLFRRASLVVELDDPRTNGLRVPFAVLILKDLRVLV